MTYDTTVSLNGFNMYIISYDRENQHISGADPGGAPGARAPPPRPPKMRPQHQNSTKLRPQNGSFRPVTIWGPPPDQILDPPLHFTYILPEVISGRKITLSEVEKLDNLTGICV